MASNVGINGNNVLNLDAAEFENKFYRHLEIRGIDYYCKLNDRLLEEYNIDNGYFNISSNELQSNDNYLDLYLGETIMKEIQKPRGGIFDGNEYIKDPDFDTLKKRTDYYFFAIINGEDGDPSSESPYYGTYDRDTADNSNFLSYIREEEMTHVQVPLRKIRWEGEFGRLVLTPLLYQNGCRSYSNGIRARTQTFYVPYIQKNETYNRGDGEWTMFGYASGNIVITDASGKSQSFDFENSIVSLRAGSTPSINDPGLYLTINGIQKYGVASSSGHKITYNNVKYIPHECPLG
jgi:hypothetical protein